MKKILRVFITIFIIINLIMKIKNLRKQKLKNGTESILDYLQKYTGRSKRIMKLHHSCVSMGIHS